MRWAAWDSAVGHNQPLPLTQLAFPPGESQVQSFKPEAEMYAAVEALSGLSGSDLVFIDDRQENAAAAAARGWHAIHHRSPADTLAQLAALGVPVIDA